MAKYIIEFSDEPIKILGKRDVYVCKDLPMITLTKSDLEHLTPYIDRNLDLVKEEVWEMASDIFAMSERQQEIIFGGDWPGDLFYSQVSPKYEAWKKEQQEVCVGDEVEDDDGTRGIVFDINGTDLLGVCWEDERVSHFFWPKSYCRKTGRHFSEAERLLGALKVK